MIERNCGVPEERWIDWHMKRLPPETARAMERHSEGCADCRRVRKQWGEWLGMAPESGSEAIGVIPMPSERVRKSLRAAAWRRSWRKKLFARPVWAVSGAVAALLLVAGVIWQGSPTGTNGETGTAALPPIEYARLHEPDGAELMALPDTKVYSIVPAYAPGLPEAGGRKSVTVWVNGRTDEMFVLIEGLLPEGSRDVQAWGEVRQDMTNLGLFEFHQAQGHLYSHFLGLPDVKEVAFTIEPKGGSAHPTSPETARIKLARVDEEE
ncbi:hypothetical protein GE107_11710 [Cohnella sp. CFH 77786]|uniref:anti-sigma factor n=1 Tax=Cohnella sp. CFH 77786 TaxID=2662265 RepID=UPI001C610140|nr:anti-sigma factor [Cohnella sp. CFH 77786]MBW5446727.1 hypothetical protein [Cohnella sp. CFH 77786]